MADWKNKPNQENEDIKYKDYAIDNTPGDFSSFSENSDPDLKTIFSDARKRELYIYPLNNLIKNNNKTNLYFSANVIKIGFIDLDEVKKVTGYEVSDFILQLDARNPTNIQDNSVEYSMIDTKTIVFQDISLMGKFNLHVVSMGEPANEYNLDQLYLINSYNERYASEGLLAIKEIILTRIKDFKIRDSNPIIVCIHKQLPEDTKVKAITITYPRQALFGNIKAIGEIDGIEGYTKLFLEDSKVALPMLAMPIEINPKVRVLQQWMSSQILSWEKAKNYIKEASVFDLINIGEVLFETRKEVFNNARITKGYIKSVIKSGNPYPLSPNWPEGNEVNLEDKIYLKIANWDEPSYPSSIRNNVYITTNNNYGDVEIETKNILKTSLQQVLLDMLNYTYNYKTNFKYAEYWDDQKLFNYGQPKNEIAKLKEEKFAGQKPDIVITNLFENWKFENPYFVDNSKVENFKQIILMLSEYILSDLSINQGLNDDYKLLLPYYFKLLSKPILEDGMYKFKDVKVKLVSQYFSFDNNIKIKNNDISQNNLFKLNSNQFNWLPLINNLEANDIPSLLPKDIKLSDGNYGKNFVNCIVNRKNLNQTMNIYGKGLEELLSNIAWTKKIINFDDTNKCKFFLENELVNFKRLEISAIFGEGKYDFEIETSNSIIKINNINLFNNKISSYCLLEI